MFALAYSSDGVPLQLPEQAIGWLVRRATHTRGRPAHVCDDTGAPLRLPLEATLEDLRSAGCDPGGYRLIPVGTDGRPVDKSLQAFTEIPGNDDSDLDASSRLARTSIEVLARAINSLVQINVEREKAHAEHVQLLTKTAEANAQLVSSLAKQQQELVSSMANNFGAYLSGTAELLKAQRAPLVPTADTKPKSVIESLQEMAKLKELVNELADKDDDESPLDAILGNEQTISAISTVSAGLVNRGFAVLDAKIDKMRAEARGPNGKALSPEEKVDAIVNHIEEKDREQAHSMITVALASDAPGNQDAERWLTMSPQIAAAEVTVGIEYAQKVSAIFDKLTVEEAQAIRAKLAELAAHEPRQYAAIMQMVLSVTVEQAAAEIRKRLSNT